MVQMSPSKEELLSQESISQAQVHIGLPLMSLCPTIETNSTNPTDRLTAPAPELPRSGSHADFHSSRQQIRLTKHKTTDLPPTQQYTHSESKTQESFLSVGDCSSAAAERTYQSVCGRFCVTSVGDAPHALYFWPEIIFSKPNSRNICANREHVEGFGPSRNVGERKIL